MFFFGGYSTILPYLVYLSIVWVCILIGVKGDIWKIFNSDEPSEQILISDNGEAYYELAYDISNHHRKTVNSEKRENPFFRQPDNNFFRRNRQLIQGIINPSAGQYSIHLESQFLRGPPEYLL